jgi:hypothetical protein
MAKTLGMLVLVACGLLWVFDGSEPDTALAGKKSVLIESAVQPLPLDGRSPVGDGTRPSPGKTVGLREQLEATHKPSDSVPSEAEGRAARVRALLSRASSLEAAGNPAGAAAVLQEGMEASSTPAEAARLGFFLAAVAASPAESRQLVTGALRQGVVRGGEYERVNDLLEQLNRSTASSLVGLTDFGDYVVQPNDSLWKLCNKTFPREFGVSPEVGLIQLVNGLSGTGLRVGQSLMVPLEPVTVEVDRRQNGLVAYLGDVALVAYRVGLGKEGRTPSGSFVVEVKLTEPTWFYDGRQIPYGDPENILGTRWMGFENNPGSTGYGIHGTSNPESVGDNQSMGCVRMRNPEVEELFGLLARGTTVNIP